MKKIILILVFYFFSFSQEKNCTILISFDGFRWDYLDRGLTPNIEKLISTGVKAKSLMPAFPSKTFPNHYTIVTGLYPENHGIIENTIFDSKTKKKFRINDTVEVRNPYWYKGEAIWETAKKQNILTASYFWPGSDKTDSSRNPNYFEIYEHSRAYSERISGIINWLNLPIEKKPELILLYFDLVDSRGHEFGPNSKEVDSSLVEADNLIKTIVDKLTENNLKEKTNLIIVSDHGMTEISLSKIVNVEKFTNNSKVQWFGPNLMIENENPEQLVEILRKNIPHSKIYLKNEMPKKYHFSKSDLISPIILVGEVGWSFTNRTPTSKDSLYFGHGNHGYDNYEMDMHGIFIANGPDFKKNYKIGTIENVDIYPLLCKILKIDENKNIDGKLQRIEKILR